MSNLLEVYDLMEWIDPKHAKAFWAAAKEGKIDESSFASAYRDELKSLGIWNNVIDEVEGERKSYGEFNYNPNYGLLKDKSTYGIIKRALEQNPDSWGLKALLKLWTLQFKENAKSKLQLELQQEQERKAKTEQDKKTIKEAIPTLTEIANRIGPDFAASYIDADKKATEEYNKAVVELETLSRGTINKGTSYVPDPADTKKMFKIRFISQGVTARVEIEYFAGRPPFYSFFVEPAEVEATAFEALLLKHLEELGKRRESHISKTQLAIAELEKEKEQLLAKIETGRKVQAAVNEDKPVDPNFIADILATLKQGKQKADKEEASWANWKYDDGDSGAAYDMNRSSTLRAIAPYLFECNWRSIVNDKEIAVWHKTDSDEDLEIALKITFNSMCPELNIEILKD